MTSIADRPVTTVGSVVQTRIGAADEAVRLSVAPPPPVAERAIAARLGFDLADLDRALTDDRARLAGEARQLRDTELAGSGERDTQLSELAGHLLAGPMALIESSDPTDSAYFALSTPSKIRTLGDLQLISSSTTAYNSYAKVVRTPSGSDGQQQVVFSFPYANTGAVDQVISVTGVIGLNGMLRAVDNGGYNIFGHGHTTLAVNAMMRRFPDTDDDQSTAIATDSAFVTELDAYDGGWPISVGAIVSQPILRGFALSATDVLVKAGQTQVFELAVAFTTAASAGETDYDFATAESRINGFALFGHVTS